MRLLFAQTDLERVRATGEIDLICGTRDRARVIDPYASRPSADRLCQVHERARTAALRTLPAGIPHGCTRALLKIEDGCNNLHLLYHSVCERTGALTAGRAGARADGAAG